MSRVMVDTSVWIEYFRSGKGAMYDFLDEAIKKNRVVICGVVLAEILRGVRGQKEERMVSDLFQAIAYLEIDRDDWENAARLLAAAQAKGLTVPLTDALIAQVCIRHGLEILTLDKHFSAFRQLKASHRG